MTAVACERPGGLQLTDRLLEAAALPSGAAVLDVGCGAGASVAHLTDAHGLRAVGVDCNKMSVTDAASARPDLAFVFGWAEQLPFAVASFDAVLCECVLSTLADPGAVLAEAARVLRPNGAVLISDLYERRAGRPGRVGRRGSLGGRAIIAELLAAAGFHVSRWEDASAALGRYVWEHAAEMAACGSAATERCTPRSLERPVPPSAAHRPPVTDSLLLGYFICAARLSGTTRHAGVRVGCAGASCADEAAAGAIADMRG
jgi:SAM-dependent methyltransferase